MEQKHILLVDDVAMNLKCVSDILSDMYRLSTAKSGKEALGLLKKSKPDLILLDVMMPDMSGYETMQYIKSNPDYADIPVIFLTADSEVESEIKGLKLGAMDYIRKPVDPEVIRGRVAKILQIEEDKRKLVVSANRDGLTGLWNRQYLKDQTDRLGRGAASGAFLLFDMDNFKQINDNYGHIMGDEVLVQFGRVLEKHACRDDVVSRLGGDEFAMLVQGESGAGRVLDKVEELLSEIEKQVNIIKGHGQQTSVSVGIALMPQDGLDFLTLYNKADKALYHVKQNGKKGYHLYHDKEQYSLIDNVDSDVNLLQLCGMFEERGEKQGAFQVEYEGFKRIYQFVERCVDRSNQEVQIVLFTLENVSGREDKLNEMIEILSDDIVSALRKGDVATRYSDTQYVVILMDASLQNGRRVAERVKGKCRDDCFRRGYELKYDIQTIRKKMEEDE